MSWHILIPESTASQDAFLILRDALHDQMRANGGFANPGELQAIVDQKLRVTFAQIRSEFGRRDAANPYADGATDPITVYGVVLLFEIRWSLHDRDLLLIGADRTP